MSLAAHPLIADWITAGNGRLLLHTGKVDIGQRISTALMQIAHEELTVPLDRIDIAPVRTGHAPDEGMTSGSNSIEQSGHALRCAAATLRSLLTELAASRMGGSAGDWTLADGALHLPGSNHRIDAVDLIADMPADAPVDPQAFVQPRSTESPRPRMRGLQDMVRGSFVFVHDLERPGMLHARVIRPPHARARLRGVAPGIADSLRAAGLFVIRDGSFLALAGPQEWPLVKAATRFADACDWDQGGGLPEMDVFEHLNAQKARRSAVVNGTPTDDPIPVAIDHPDHAARYERPYQMHGSLAPSAAVAEWNGETLKLHCHSQGIYPLRTSIADSLGLDDSQVDITHVAGSGCYGHNGADDAAFEAALIAMTLPERPILLKWTRQDEHAWEPYASAMALDLSAKLTDDRITAYSAEVYSDTHRGRPRPGPDRAGPARLLANRFRADPIGPMAAQPNPNHHAGMHRNLDPVYEFGDKRLVRNLVGGLPHRTSSMRCLGAAVNIFAHECFVDELIRREGADPIAFRRSHLKDPRALAVLAELDRQIKARPDLADGRGRGIAYAQYKNLMTRVGVCVELAVNDRAEIRLLHAAIVADAGRVIDAEGLQAQLEGGFIQAASWALYEQITWDRDGTISRDWDSYRVIRFDNIPAITVTVLDQPQAKSVGAGEAAPGPSLAAIGNAVFDATGIRMRRIPFTPDAILQRAVKG